MVALAPYSHNKGKPIPGWVYNVALVGSLAFSTGWRSSQNNPFGWWMTLASFDWID